MLNKIKILFTTRYLVRSQRIKFIINNLAGKEFGFVIDIGAGKVPYKKFIKCKKYIGVDIEDRGGLEDVIITDVNNGIPQVDQTVDLVLMFEVLEHIKKPQFVLTEINRILNNDGQLVMTVPFVWVLHETPNDYFRYTRYGLEYMLRVAGFSNIKIIPSNNYYYTICQLLNINLRHKIFYPIVFLINVFGIVFRNISKNYDFPLGYYVISSKK